MATADEGCSGVDGPVLLMMNKRLRALKKKYNRIVQIEEARGQGKPINREQEDVLKSKVQVSLLIDEYEKLRRPLLAALKEEIAEKEKEWIAAKESEQAGTVEDKEAVMSNVDSSVEEARTESEHDGVLQLEDANGHDKSSPSLDSSQQGDQTGVADEQLGDVIQLLYFASLFDVKPEDVKSENQSALVRLLERSSCLSYDFVADEDLSSPLGEQDLDRLAKFGSLILSRPPNATVSHKDALQNCISHSRLWLLNSDVPISSDINITYADLRERFNRILSSEYFTMTPELQTVTRELQAKTQHLAKPGGAPEYHGAVEEHAENGDATTEDAPQTENGAKADAETASDAAAPQENGGPSQQNFQRRTRGYRGSGRGGYGRGGRGYPGYQGGRGAGGRVNRGGYANDRTGGGGVGQYYEGQYYQPRSYYGNGNSNGGAPRRGKAHYTTTNGAAAQAPPTAAAAAVETQS